METELMPLVLPDDDGIRPAMGPDICAYCQQKIGTPHKENCVILHKKIKVRYGFDLWVEVPYSWTKEQIESHKNAHWCGNNAFYEVESFHEELNKSGLCLCNYLNIEVLEMPDAKPYRINQSGEIVE